MGAIIAACGSVKAGLRGGAGLFCRACRDDRRKWPRTGTEQTLEDNFFTVWVVGHWRRVCREVVQGQSLEVFVIAIWRWVMVQALQWPLWVIFKVSSTPDHAMIVPSHAAGPGHSQAHSRNAFNNPHLPLALPASSAIAGAG